MFISGFEPDTNWLDNKEKEFKKIENDGKTESLYEEMRDFFSQIDPANISKFWFSYWRWFTIVSWDRLNILSENELLSVFQWQLPMACLCGVDPIKKLLIYFDVNNYNANGAESLFRKIINRLSESSAPLGVKQDGLSVGQVFKELQLARHDSDSMKVADFRGKIKLALTIPDGYEHDKYFVRTADEVDTQLCDLMDVFQTVDPASAWYMAYNYLYMPDEAGVEGATVVDNVVEENTELDAIEKELEEDELNAVVSENPVGHVPTPNPYLALKTSLEAEFPRDADGHFLNMAEVLARLEAIAKDSGDERVKELYYFDEQTGTFRWNEEMLNG